MRCRYCNTKYFIIQSQTLHAAIIFTVIIRLSRKFNGYVRIRKPFIAPEHAFRFVLVNDDMCQVPARIRDSFPDRRHTGREFQGTNAGSGETVFPDFHQCVGNADAFEQAAVVERFCPDIGNSVFDRDRPERRTLEQVVINPGNLPDLIILLYIMRYRDIGGCEVEHLTGERIAERFQKQR